jgi:glucose uptake protein GlcU
MAGKPVSSASQPSPLPAAAMVFVGVGTGVVVLLTSTRLTPRPRRQAAILGATSGAMFGLTAGLLKLLGASASSADPAAAGLLVAALAGTGVLGTAMNQRAYQIAPLSASMPLLNVLDVLVAVAFGALVFHETPAHSAVVLLLQCVAMACLGVGLRQIARLGTCSSVPSETVTTPERRIS